MRAEHRVAEIVAAEGIADYAQDLRELSAAALQRLFAFASSSKLNATRVIKNLIGQAYTAIRAGRRSPATCAASGTRPCSRCWRAWACPWKAAAPRNWCMMPSWSW